MPDDTLYDRLGEREGIQAVVDDFYDRLLADDDLGPFFAGADMEKLRRPGVKMTSRPGDVNRKRIPTT